MQNTEVFSSIRVPEVLRKKLKILSVYRDKPMYVLVQEWLDRELAKTSSKQVPSHDHLPAE